MKRYVIRAVFDDPDFGSVQENGYFFFKGNALNHWRELESWRRALQGRSQSWHFEVFDTKTQSVIKP